MDLLHRLTLFPVLITLPLLGSLNDPISHCDPLARISHTHCSSKVRQPVSPDRSEAKECKVCKPCKESILGLDGETDGSLCPMPCEKCGLECLQPDYCCIPSDSEEREFLSYLSCESRRLYQTLDCEGKNRAIELSLCYCDLDCAVEQAAREMYLRQLGQYPNLEDYEERIEDESGQNAYNRRFGY